MGQHNPRPVVGGQLARVLKGRFRLTLQVRCDHNGLQALFKAHARLPAAADVKRTFRILSVRLQNAGGSDPIHPPL
jgi:hypothetical protein